MASQGKTRVVGDEDAFLELPRKMNDTGAAAPRLDAHEVDGLILMTAEVPGVPESAIGVSLDGDILTISIDKRDRNKGKRVLFSERSYGQFERSIQLPFAPDPERVHAAIEHGLLTVSFPRVARERTRHIAVNGARPEPKEERSAFVSEWADLGSTSDMPVTLDVTATRLA